jgi:hypothetical protein
MLWVLDMAIVLLVLELDMVLEPVQTLQQQLVVDMVPEELLELGDMVMKEVLEPGVMVPEEVLEPGGYGAGGGHGAGGYGVGGGPGAGGYGIGTGDTRRTGTAFGFILG